MTKQHTTHPCSFASILAKTDTDAYFPGRLGQLKVLCLNLDYNAIFTVLPFNFTM